MMIDGTSTAVLAGYAIPGAVAQPGGGAAPLAFTPMTGLWWNPNESGTGYNIQVQRGVLVATLYSYAPTGDPVWYLAVGPLANAGGSVAAVGTLDKYRGGQCASSTIPATLVDRQRGQITLRSHRPQRRPCNFPAGASPRFSRRRGSPRLRPFSAVRGLTRCQAPEVLRPTDSARIARSLERPLTSVSMTGSALRSGPLGSVRFDPRHGDDWRRCDPHRPFAPVGRLCVVQRPLGEILKFRDRPQQT